MIRDLVVAASPVMRAGLESVVRGSAALEFAGACSPGELETRIAAVAPDVLLIEAPALDLAVPDVPGSETFSPGDDWHSLPSVILTEAAEPALVAAALRAGVRSVLSREAGSSEIVAALAAAAAGLVTLPPGTFEQLLSDPRPVPAELEEPLSRRELEVLAMLAEGLSNKLIAHRLGISDHTVKFHVTSILSKMRAGSRTDAVMQGIRLGLIMV